MNKITISLALLTVITVNCYAETAKDYIIQGNEAYKEGNLGQAVSDYTKAIEIDPNDVMAYVDRGNVYDINKNFIQALSDYNKAIKLNPNDANAYSNRGTVYSKQKIFIKAISDFNRRHPPPCRHAGAGRPSPQAMERPWIAVPGAPAAEYGVYHFRRALELAAKPERFLAHASGDNRYQLFVNGQRVAWGPARGDLFHWRYETVDSRRLPASPAGTCSPPWSGTSASLRRRPRSPSTPASCWRATPHAERAADTGPAWKVRPQRCLFARSQFTAARCAATSPPARATGWRPPRYPWGWESAAISTIPHGRRPMVIGPAAGPRGPATCTRAGCWCERTIPMEEERPSACKRCAAPECQAGGLSAQPEAVPFPPARTDVAARPGLPDHRLSRADRVRRNAARPCACATPNRSSSPGARRRGLEKGNRDEIEGKEFIGNFDEFVPMAAPRRLPPALVAHLPLSAARNRNQAPSRSPWTICAPPTSAIPSSAARGSTPMSPELEPHSRCRLAHCAPVRARTYMDCPYYEQLQYVGDTRVQCLVSLFKTGDARLMRNAIDLIDDSRQSDGAP